MCIIGGFLSADDGGFALCCRSTMVSIVPRLLKGYAHELADLYPNRRERPDRAALLKSGLLWTRLPIKLCIRVHSVSSDKSTDRRTSVFTIR